MNSFPYEQLLEQASLVIDPSIPKSAYVAIDLSVNNADIANLNASSSSEWERFIKRHLQSHQKKIAFGGYLEKRNLYQRSAYFKHSETERNIHLGIDFWVDAGTSVHAVLDGTVHSFQDNKNHGDYGPTILLQHDIGSETFYSLYGHLSRESLENLSVGAAVKAGEAIATLGEAAVNGDYAPHLHFQLIRDIESKLGDYPGVCSLERRQHFAENCPNPLPLLGLY